MQNTLSNEYPYGQFPTQYTKLGQEQMKKQWQERTAEKKESSKNVNIQSDGNDKCEHSANTIDIHKILPLIKKMNSNTPISQGDLISMLMGLMGKENSDLADIFSVIANTKTVKESDIKSMSINSNMPAIDSFKKVE